MGSRLGHSLSNLVVWFALCVELMPGIGLGAVQILSCCIAGSDLLEMEEALVGSSRCVSFVKMEGSEERDLVRHAVLFCWVSFSF
jgi:hypothetical protein